MYNKINLRFIANNKLVSSCLHREMLLFYHKANRPSKKILMHDIRYFITICYYKTCHYTGIAIGISLQSIKIRFFNYTVLHYFFIYHLIHYINMCYNKSTPLQGIAIGISWQGITIRLVITSYYNKTLHYQVLQ